MESTVKYHAQTTVDTELVIFRMELVLNVKLVIKEPYVQQVLLIRFFIYEKQLSKFITLLTYCLVVFLQKNYVN